MGGKHFPACSNLGLSTLLDPPRIYTDKSFIMIYSSNIVVTVDFSQQCWKNPFHVIITLG